MKRTVLLLGLTLACSSTPGAGDMASEGSGSGGTTAPGGSSGGGSPAVGGAMPAAGGASAGAGGTGAGGGATGGGGTGSGGAPPIQLGMNDVTILVPLPATVAAPVLVRGTDTAADGTVFVPQALVDRLVDDPISSDSIAFPGIYEELQLVSVRFDLCDHEAPGHCPTSGDASLRLVFQPLRDLEGAADTGFHAFYTILEAEIPAALAALTELSLLRTGPAEPLTVSVPLSEGNAEYTVKLRGFVRSYGGESRLIRLTMNTQNALSAAVAWVFRGVEKQGTEFQDIVMAGTGETIQKIMLDGEGFFDVQPASDVPQGLAFALDFSAFNVASEEEQIAGLKVFPAIDNPLTNAPDTANCVACHTSTVALAVRAEELEVDAMTLTGRYETPFDVSVAAGMSRMTDRTLRALGWFGKDPLISQRVANDTALVLEDIAARYPAAP